MVYLSPLCVCTRRDFSPPRRKSFIRESEHQTRNGNPGSKEKDRSISKLLVYLQTDVSTSSKILQGSPVKMFWGGDGGGGR